MRVRRIAVNILLGSSFVLVLIIIIAPCVADMSYNLARKLEAENNLIKAEESYRLAIRMNPFNAQCRAELAEYLLRKSADKKGMNRLYWLQAAKKLYGEAVRLNPRNAEYALRLGQAELSLFLRANDAAEKERAFSNFKKALENDPNGFNVSYSVGYAGLMVWDHLDDNEKKMILDKLRYTIKSKPWYGIYVYPQLWQLTGDFEFLKIITPNSLAGNKSLYAFVINNGLRRYAKEERSAIGILMKMENPEEYEREKSNKRKRIESLKLGYRAKARNGDLIASRDWTGKADSEPHAYENGCMYWTGTMDAVIDLPGGDVIIKVQAKGSPANNVYPYMIIELDGKEIGETFVDSAEWKEYSFKASSAGEVKVLSITFANDFSNEKEDRNLYIGEVRRDHGER